MARRLRVDVGGIVYHVLNRRVGREAIFKKDEDYAAFERVLDEAGRLQPMRRFPRPARVYWELLICGVA